MTLHGLSHYLFALCEAADWANKNLGFFGEARHRPPSTVAVNAAWFAPTLVEIVQMVGGLRNTWRPRGGGRDLSVKPGKKVGIPQARNLKFQI